MGTHFSRHLATRREFLMTGTVAAFGVAHGLPQGFPRERSAMSRHAVPWRTHPALLESTTGITTLRDPRIKALVARALDAARDAGARYADVRVTYTRNRSIRNKLMGNDERLGLSVRALVEGVWGFASSPYVTDDEAPRLGRLAASTAKSIVSRTPARVVELGTIPVVPHGDWTTPIRIDPFDVPEVEIIDYLHGLEGFAEDCGRVAGRKVEAVWFLGVPISFTKQERVVGTTEGSYLTQTLHKMDARLAIRMDGRIAYLPGTGLVGAGWEYVYDQTAQMREAIPRLIAQNDAEMVIPATPVDVGRYDVVFSAQAMAEVLSRTFGPATELDRALGYEANAGGTSYLGPDPHAMLGTTVAAPSITVTANRSVSRGLATVQWDDEGVVPEDFPLIEQGKLVDYQTTREHAAWLAPWYQTRGRAVRSHGCATSPTALELPMQHTPNLTLHPGSGTEDFETLIAGMASGIAVGFFGAVDMDFQCLNGMGLCTAYEVKKGKRVAQLVGQSGQWVGLLFRSPEFWKNIIVLGGPASAKLIGLENRSRKGEPRQSTDYSVSVVPAVVKQLAVIDPKKKA